MRPRKESCRRRRSSKAERGRAGGDVHARDQSASKRLALRLRFALLPSLALFSRYVIGSHIQLKNANDKLLPSFADMGETIYAYAFRSRSAHRPVFVVVGHGGEPQRGFDRSSPSRRSRPRRRHHHRLAAHHGRDVFSHSFGVLSDRSPARAPADPVHRHGPRRSLEEDHADLRRRHDVEAGPATLPCALATSRASN